MKKSRLKFIITSAIITMSMGLFAGCAADNSNSNSGEISGSISVVGSTALQPLVDSIAKEFTSENPDVSIDVQGGGSGAGLTAVLDKTAEIGMSDVKAEVKIQDAEKLKAFVDHIICLQAFAVVVSKDVTITNLSKVQIQDIFQGKITNWNQVGGKDEEIVVVNRTKTSGTRATFHNTVMEGKDENEAIGTTQDASGGVKTALESTQGAISYLAMSYLVDPATLQNLKIISVDDVMPTKENITSKKYPFIGEGNIYTNGEATGAVKAFIDFMTSEAGLKEIDKLGYYPAK